MEKRNIVVIGASAGGFDAIKKLVADLPSDLGASVFIVWHMSPDVRGVLPHVLNNMNSLPAAHGINGEQIIPGRIYVAPPDRHMLIDGDTIRISRGPKENRFRPAIDPLFRSAALHYRSRVIGVILSGALDDGSAGLWAVRQQGGMAIVQDPHDAEVPAMPENAIKAVAVDHVIPVAEMGALITTLAQEPVTNVSPSNKLPDQTKMEVDIAMEDNILKNNIFEYGELSPYTCPECHGVLATVKEGGRVRFLCHTGHAFSADSLLASITENIEENMWGAIRNVQESVMLLNHMGDHFAEANNPKLAGLYYKKARDAEKRAEIVKQAVFDHELRSSNEQHELHAEELKASNEELQAMNEELRSAAEELETSKEELQSINEELRTVNQELKVKVEETTLASNNLQNLINSVDIATIFLDRSFRVAFFTPSARELFNLIPADYGRPLTHITSKLAYDELITDAEHVLEKLQPVEKEVRTTDSHVYMMRVLPYRTAEDRINGVVITFINITAHKQIEEALRTSEERQRMLIESAKDYAIFTFDNDRKATSWNTGAEAMTGYTEQEILHQSCDVIFVPEDREKNAPAMEQETARAKGLAINERWHMRKDGSRYYGSGTVRPLLDSNNNIHGFVKIMRDLTASKLLEQQKDQFIGIASHELKTPVTIITSYTELLTEKLEGKNYTEAGAIAKKLSTQVQRLNDLVVDLLDVTRISEGQVQLHKEEFDMNELINEVVSEMQGLAPGHNIKTDLRADKKLLGDNQRIRQVLTNLMYNAIKYSPAANEIIVSSRSDAAEITVCVQDFGIGMEAGMDERIFDRFYKIEDASGDAFPGLGLGLYIASDIVKRHGGKISVNSKKNEGSTFCFSIPLAQ